MRLGHFLAKKPVTIKYRVSEADDMVSFMKDFSFGIADQRDYNMHDKLHLSLLNDLVHKLSKRKAYIHQKDIRITYTHSEALLLLMIFPLLDNPLPAIQYTINQLHKHYI